MSRQLEREWEEDRARQMKGVETALVAFNRSKSIHGPAIHKGTGSEGAMGTRREELEGLAT